jgi:hypothetical protein
VRSHASICHLSNEKGPRKATPVAAPFMCVFIAFNFVCAPLALEKDADGLSGGRFSGEL